ncbi:MAG: hypothetical protein JWQ09_432 [Segetibacter sp.]|nr:hypothetical protein [Segetibacter sp.]
MQYPLSEKQKKSFKNQQYEEIVLQPGVELYRFCKGRNFNLKFSDFWMDKEAVKEIFRTFGELTERSKRQNYNFDKAVIATISVRHTLAISKNWNNLLYLHTAKVKRPIEAAYGITASQPLYNLEKDDFNPSEMTLKGGGKQYVVPLFSYLINENRSSEITDFAVTEEFNLFADTSWYQRFVMAGYTLQ